MTLPKGLYRRGNCYYLDYRDETGRRVRRSAGRNLHHALDLLHKLRGSDHSSECQISLKSLLDSYLARLRVYAKRKSVGNAESAARQILSRFGDPAIQSMTQQNLDQFISDRRREGVVDKTINGDLIILRAALNHGVSLGRIEKLPVKVKLLKVAKRRISRTLSRDDIKRLLDCSAGRIHGVLLIAACTGFRTDEILHLQWRDVGWDDGSLRITTKPGVWSSKNHQERSVFVSEALVAWLRDYRSKSARGGDGDWIFSTRNGTPMTIHNVCRAVRKVFERAEVYEKGTSTIHRIRHTVACTLLSNGTDLETVRDWLGHADVSTTSIYLHTTDQRKKEAARRLQLAQIEPN
jgi:integrase/recombinase XerD